MSLELYERSNYMHYIVMALARHMSHLSTGGFFSMHCSISLFIVFCP